MQRALVSILCDVFSPNAKENGQVKTVSWGARGGEYVNVVDIPAPLANAVNFKLAGNNLPIE